MTIDELSEQLVAIDKKLDNLNQRFVELSNENKQLRTLIIEKYPKRLEKFGIQLLEANL